MSSLVMSQPPPLLGLEDPRLSLQPSNYPLHGGLEVVHGDAGAGLPGGDQGGLVTNIRNLSSGKSVCQSREILCQGLRFFILRLDSRQMNLEYFCSTSDVRQRNLNVSVKSSRSQKSRVKRIKSVSGPKYDYLRKLRVSIFK